MTIAYFNVIFCPVPRPPSPPLAEVRFEKFWPRIFRFDGVAHTDLQRLKRIVCHCDFWFLSWALPEMVGHLHLQAMDESLKGKNREGLLDSPDSGLPPSPSPPFCSLSPGLLESRSGSCTTPVENHHGCYKKDTKEGKLVSDIFSSKINDAVWSYENIDLDLLWAYTFLL